MSIYLDHAATTPIDKEVKREMQKYLSLFSNPSSIHKGGELAMEALEGLRRRAAQVLKVQPEEIIFTGSGTESDNLAIIGVSEANKNLGNYIITTSIEHMAVLRSCQNLESKGLKVDYISPKKDGLVDPDDIVSLIKNKTILVSIMQANNEVGTIQPIKEISAEVKRKREEVGAKIPYIHTDSCQAVGYLPIQPHMLGVDLMTINSSKIYGPKGAGLLFVKRGTHINPIIWGGSQEYGLRAGTENISQIAGFVKALEIADKDRKENYRKESELRDYLIKRILEEIPGSKLNGHPKKRLPNNINFSFKGISGEMLVLDLSEKGFYISTGSACTTAETGPSYVIKALGGHDEDWGNIRVTIGRETKKKDLEKFFVALKKSINKLKSF